MTETESRMRRLAFVGIDENARATLREIKPLILDALPDILDRFYLHVAEFEETKRLFSSELHMRHAKAMQIAHWDTILSAAFDETYFESSARIGRAHHRLGLEPRWYIGAYRFLLSDLLQALEKAVPGGWFARNAEASRARLQSALTAAAFLDMDMAISVYLESGIRTKQETLDRLGASFRSIVDAVSASATELEATAGSLLQTADMTQQLSSEVAVSSDRMRASVDSAAAATGELRDAVNEIALQVQEARLIAQQAVSQAEATDRRVAQLAQAAGHIGAIVKLISDIAEQTNLLALNATIEAARAGDYGKGFAVVAQEVKALAAQTARATEEIGSQIGGMQSATQEAVGAIKDVGATIAKIAEISSLIVAAVEKQESSAGTISANVQQAACGTSGVAGAIHQVRDASRATGTASEEVLAAAKGLSRESSRLKDEIEHFLITVRAA
ncbi:MAG: globin-coupled sensor protein [Pseudorhodoplanes sp.]|nr:globin-coupled sensor protein [Pseudorhodoplanes sp.]